MPHKVLWSKWLRNLLFCKILSHWPQWRSKMHTMIRHSWHHDLLPVPGGNFDGPLWPSSIYMALLWAILRDIGANWRKGWPICPMRFSLKTPERINKSFREGPACIYNIYIYIYTRYLTISQEQKIGAPRSCSGRASWPGLWANHRLKDFESTRWRQLMARVVTLCQGTLDGCFDRCDQW